MYIDINMKKQTKEMIGMLISVRAYISFIYSNKCSGKAYNII